MSTVQLRLAVDTAPVTAIAAVSGVLFKMRDHSPGVAHLGNRMALALADMEGTGEVDPQLVSELFETPLLLNTVTELLTTCKEHNPESVGLVDALLGELEAAREQAESLRAGMAHDLDDDAKGDWT